MTATRPEALVRVLPDTVTARESPADERLLLSLFPSECDVVRGAVAKRRAEFAGGRTAAHACLDALGISPAPLLPGPGRAPVWPDGVVGSIAHAAGRALAAVARTRDLSGIGIDLEPDEPVEEDLFASILTRREIATLAGEANPGRAVRALFTAKEAVYKCLGPLTGVFLEFHGVEIEREGETFRPRLLQSVPPDFPRVDGLRGHTVRDAGFVVSALWIT
jgi:4'-phosphopantetheinyl transferase EntD